MFKTVLVPVDVSLPDDTRRVLAAAKTLTSAWEGCKVHVITIVPDVGMAIVGSYFDKKFENETHHKAEDELKAAVAEAGIDATCHVSSGTVYDKVIQKAEKVDADLIVISAHSPELKDYLLGSNASRIVRHSDRSVLVLRH